MSTVPGKSADHQVYGAEFDLTLAPIALGGVFAYRLRVR